MTRTPPGDDAEILPFPAQPAPRPAGVGTQALAALITLTQAAVDLIKLAMLLGFCLLAGLGVAALLAL